MSLCCWNVGCSSPVAALERARSAMRGRRRLDASGPPPGPAPLRGPRPRGGGAPLGATLAALPLWFLALCASVLVFFLVLRAVLVCLTSVFLTLKFAFLFYLSIAFLLSLIRLFWLSGPFSVALQFSGFCSVTRRVEHRRCVHPVRMVCCGFGLLLAVVALCLPSPNLLISALGGFCALCAFTRYQPSGFGGERLVRRLCAACGRFFAPKRQPGRSWHRLGRCCFVLGSTVCSTVLLFHFGTPPGVYFSANLAVLGA